MGTHETDTRTRLLDAAEALFAERGVAVTSLRQITAAAEANLASVNYHFGSKTELITEVYARQIDPLNRERIRRLESAVEAAAPGPVPVEQVVLAVVAPALELRGGDRGRALVRLLGRMHSEPSNEIRQTVFSRFGEVFERVLQLLSVTLPHLEPDELATRLHFVVGSLAFTMMEPLPLPGSAADPEVEQARLVAFASAGLRAPANPTKKESS